MRDEFTRADVTPGELIVDRQCVDGTDRLIGTFRGCEEGLADQEDAVQVVQRIGTALCWTFTFIFRGTRRNQQSDWTQGCGEMVTYVELGTFSFSAQTESGGSTAQLQVGRRQEQTSLAEARKVWACRESIADTTRQRQFVHLFSVNLQ